LKRRTEPSATSKWRTEPSPPSRIPCAGQAGSEGSGEQYKAGGEDKKGDDAWNPHVSECGGEELYKWIESVGEYHEIEGQY